MSNELERARQRLINFDEITSSPLVYSVSRRGGLAGVDVEVRRDTRHMQLYWTFAGWSISNVRLARQRAERKLLRAEARARRELLDEITLAHEDVRRRPPQRYRGAGNAP